VRLHWFPNPNAPERLEAVEDRLWWPAVARADAHPHSLAAVERVAELVGGQSAVLTALLAAARGGRLGWTGLIPELFRHCEGRWRDNPRQWQKLTEAARVPDEADVVAALVGMLNDSAGLPTVLTRGGQHLRLVHPLEPIESRTTIRDGTATRTTTYPPAPVGGELVLRVGGTPDEFFRVAVCLNDEEERWVFVRSGGSIEPLLKLTTGQAVELRVDGTGRAPPEVQTGVYVPTHSEC
jgi:hypothetical protein